MFITFTSWLNYLLNNFKSGINLLTVFVVVFIQSAGSIVDARVLIDNGASLVNRSGNATRLGDMSQREATGEFCIDHKLLFLTESIKRLNE